TAVAILQQAVITQSGGKHTVAFLFEINMLGASSMPLLCVAALANRAAITCEPRLDQVHA
ncbi:MAG: hypothetical protein ABW153_05865, partial [Sedimenticola sp.]